MNLLRSALSGTVAGVILVAIFTLEASAAANPVCEISVEREIIDALINHQPENAAILLSRMNESRLTISSVEFYRGLINWRLGKNTQDQEKIDSAIAQLLITANSLNSNYDKRNSIENLTAAGLARAHVARIMIDDERFLAGYRLGTKAVQQVRHLLDIIPPDHPDRVDVSFVMGLYDIYADSVPDKLAWLLDQGKTEGKREAGIVRLEQVISQSRIFAAEAARSLLMEVPWRIPQMCRYLPLAFDMRKRFPQNPDLTIVLQGLLLKCGHADQALAENNRALQQFPRQIKEYPLLIEGRYRALADIIDVDRLNQPGDINGDLELYRQLALGNALDLAGKRQQALKVYQSLLAQNPDNQRVRQRASNRIRYPYRKPRMVSFDHAYDLSIFC